MHLWEVTIISIGLSLETFTLAIMKGANQKLLPTSRFFFMSLLCGAIETIMLICGMLIGIFPLNYIHNDSIQLFSKWFSAILLVFLGLKMFNKIKREFNVEEHREEKLTYKEVIKLGVRAGVDVLLLGIIFAVLGTPLVGIYIIFISTFLCAPIGLWLGGRLGSHYKFIIDGASGIILLVMEIKVVAGVFKMI